MKKAFAPILIITLVFAACDSGITSDGNGDNGYNGKSTTLKIKNESFTEITDVIWQDVSFSNNTNEKSIKSGTSATNSVMPGTGYIFFKRKSNPIVARTNDLIMVEKDQEIEFTFTNNTVIVETNNPNNNGTLGALESTVVWWDDAEGEMQPYFLRQSYVEYYDSTNIYGGIFSISFPPKNGLRSIYIGVTTNALLHLKINLKKPAKLSFWYANKRSPESVNGASFSINGTTKITINTEINWSFVSFDLAPGENDLVWEKKDGYYTYPSGYSFVYYLSLDDILIYYTE